jgi:hypothetical protein
VMGGFELDDDEETMFSLPKKKLLVHMRSMVVDRC